jgi:hypothetical protein
MVGRPATHTLGRVTTRKVAGTRAVVGLRGDTRTPRVPGCRAAGGRLTAAVRMIIWGQWPARLWPLARLWPVGPCEAGPCPAGPCPAALQPAGPCPAGPCPVGLQLAGRVRWGCSRRGCGRRNPGPACCRSRSRRAPSPVLGPPASPQSVHVTLLAVARARNPRARHGRGTASRLACEREGVRRGQRDTCVHRARTRTAC